jgi:ADP-heptose:LPS heptosyltransferase
MAIIVDGVVRLVAPLLVSRRLKSAVPRGRPRVLLIRCDHIGDAVLASTVLAPLRAKLNPERLDVLVAPWAAPLFEGHASVDGIITYATPWWLAARRQAMSTRLQGWLRLPGVIRAIRSRRYDVGIDLRGDLRHILFFLALGGIPERVSSDRTGGSSLLTRVRPHEVGQHEVDQNAATVSLLGVHAPMRLDLSAPASLSDALEQAVRSASGPNGFIALSLRGNEPNRSWPVSHAIRLTQMAWEQLGVGAVLLGGAADRDYAQHIEGEGDRPFANLADRTTLTEALAVLSRARAAVSVDSGPMHLAAAAGTRVVALFGPGNPAESRPWTRHCRIVGDRTPCGCVHPWCEFRQGPGRCMDEIQPEAVLHALESVLAHAD